MRSPGTHSVIRSRSRNGALTSTRTAPGPWGPPPSTSTFDQAPHCGHAEASARSSHTAAGEPDVDATVSIVFTPRSSQLARPGGGCSPPRSTATRPELFNAGVPELRVRRDDLASSELVEGESRREDLDDCEAQLRVERFALSANNITYAELGDQLGYWRLFPAPEGWGRIPAWGHARVVASRSPGLAEGQRVLGLVPMGTHVTVQAAANPLGFFDAAPHRAELSPIYNQYLSLEDDGDDAALVMRPLFITSLLLDLVLSEAGFEGARSVVLTSASSKTAYGLAHLLRGRPVETIGLTSAPRRPWVESLRLYDKVLSYDEVGDLEAPDGAVLVDFAGNGAHLRDVHERLGEALKRSIMVGFTHRRAATDAEPPPSPDSQFFFAPDEIAQRAQDLGRQYAEAWRGFAPVVQRAMRIERITDGDELVRAYRELLDGRADPAVGFVVSL